jgi:hypothetical protein
VTVFAKGRRPARSSPDSRCTFLGVAVPQCGTTGSPRQSSRTPSASLAPGLDYAQIATTNGLYGPHVPDQFYAITVTSATPSPTLVLGARPPSVRPFRSR